ncbi:kinetochore Nuf2 [Brachionus plicatilis]|uniref:Kinetochore Nuf2 n=1 Tax=Brachionus plicatilis TaxID=10195 RepID=A0A3M7QM36_BRAPC|nr:kinetochore Nuf2 [Brachionus plicatilis]
MENDPKCLHSILRNLNINVSLKDIKQPTMESYLAIYKGFMEMCFLIKAPVLDEIPPSSIANFSEDCIKNQADSFKFLQLYSLINFMYSIMSAEYSMTEIFNPPRKLFFKQISSLINFARFLFDELNEYGKIQTENKALMENLNEIKKECDEYANKIDNLQTEAKQKKPLIEATKKRIAALKENQNLLRQARNKLADKNEIAKKEEQNLISDKNDLTEKVSSFKKKMDLYEMLLIKSPDRLKRDMEKNEARIIDLEKLSKAKKCENQELRKDIFERERFVEMANGVRDAFENFFNNEVQKANSKLKEIEKIQDEITSISFELKELENMIDLLSKNKKELEHQIQNQTLELKQKISKFKNEEEDISNKIKEILNRIQQTEDEVARIDEETSISIKKTQEMMAISFKQMEICKREEKIAEAKYKAEEIYLLDCQKETLDKVEEVKKAQDKMSHFLDKALEEYTKNGTFNFENLNI